MQTVSPIEARRARGIAGFAGLIPAWINAMVKVDRGCGPLEPESTAMKTLLVAIVPAFALVSCVFEAPFEAESRIPTDPALLGRWEAVSEKSGETPERMLVLQHSANEYVAGYPMGEKSMVFRGYHVDLEGGRYIQIQLIGTAEGPVKPENRKFHLLKVTVDGDAMELRTINTDVIGKELKDSAALKAAFAAHKEDPKLFGEPQKFRRVK